MTLSFASARHFLAGEKVLLPRLVEVLLVLAMAWVVSGWFVGGSTIITTSGHMDTGDGSASVPSAQAVAAIPLFGKAEVTDAVKPVARDVAPSHLSIQVLGTVVAGKASAAVLALRPGEEQKVFSLGDTIEPGVVLKAVEPDAIVVDNHGRMERITMAKSVLSSAPPPVTVDGGAGPGNIDISRANLNNQLNNLPVLLTQAKAIPHQMNGKVDGVMIDDIVPGSLYAKAGLRNLDVIRKVDGRPVTRLDQGVQLYQLLKDKHNIDIEIARAGSVRHLHYTIR